MDTMPFDLLALPRVALQTCFSFMPPSHLISISRTSDRCKEIIKCIKFDVNLIASGREVEVVYLGDRGSTLVHISPGNVVIDEQEWRDLVTEVTRLFGRSLSIMCMTTRNFEETWKWIHKEQREVKRLSLGVKNIDNPQETIKTILNDTELKQLEYLSLGLEVSETFQFTDPFILKKPLEALTISDSSWFTVENLMDCQVEEWDLYESKLTDEDFNLVLKNWKNQVDNLKNLKIVQVWRVVNTRTNINVLLDGLQREEEIHENNHRVFKLTYDYEFYLHVEVHGYYLRIEKTSRTRPFS